MNVRPGFGHRESYPVEGVYFNPAFNIKTTRRQFEGHATDITTNRALRRFEKDRDDAFFFHISHKAPHYPFEPPKRYDGYCGDEPIDYPETMANTEENDAGNAAAGCTASIP